MGAEKAGGENVREWHARKNAPRNANAAPKRTASHVPDLDLPRHRRGHEQVLGPPLAMDVYHPVLVVRNRRHQRRLHPQVQHVNEA